MLETFLIVTTQGMMGSTTGSKCVEVSNAATHPTTHVMPSTTKNYSVPTANSVEVDESCSKFENIVWMSRF
jgi:hypothetical protein